MNIWIFNPYDPVPGEGLGELRYARLARELVLQGHDVTWWSADWNHALKRRRDPEEKINGQMVEWGAEAKSKALDANIASTQRTSYLTTQLIRVPQYHKNISLRRVWSHWRYARGIAVRADDYVQTHGKPDVILFSVPPMEAGSVALMLGQRYGARVILDVMDAWPETLQRLPAAKIADSGWRATSALLRLVGRVVLWPYTRMMRRYCREVDAVCAQSEAFAEYARAFGKTGDISVFYLGAANRRLELEKGQREHDPVGKPNYLTETPLSVPASYTPRLLYLGSMGRVYDLHTLVEAVIRLLDQGEAIRLDLVGEGEQRIALEAKVASAGRSAEIVFHGYLQGGALTEVMAKADVGVVPMYPESAVAVPYKVCDYLAAGLPVINSLPGELQTMLDASGCGEFYDTGDAASLAGALRPWLDDVEALKSAKEAACALFDEQFDADKIYPDMAAWVAAQ